MINNAHIIFHYLPVFEEKNEKLDSQYTMTICWCAKLLQSWKLKRCHDAALSITTLTWSSTSYFSIPGKALWNLIMEFSGNCPTAAVCRIILCPVSNHRQSAPGSASGSEMLKVFFKFQVMFDNHHDRQSSIS